MGDSTVASVTEGAARAIEPTLFSYIWKHSKLDQIKLVAVTAILFPLQYLSLEIPKQIINGAIGATTATVDVFGLEMERVTLLGVLCMALLATVIGQGLLKMRLNTMKGMLAERMLQRFRFMLTTRLFRFPGRYFRRTSQGELVSMVTSESEALGGMMGDAISQPLFQGGQMITILAFLVIQSPWLGLAAAALIPLQAWLIPQMQRQINLLARERVKEVRKFATVIGESADGAVHFRRAGGLAYWRALITHRLSRLAAIRFEIYKKKFFMKFVNNFITQLTPLMFFAFGGYLVIQGDLTVGALVAALAAHKDPRRSLERASDLLQPSSGNRDPLPHCYRALRPGRHDRRDSVRDHGGFGSKPRGNDRVSGCDGPRRRWFSPAKGCDL